MRYEDVYFCRGRENKPEMGNAWCKSRRTRREYNKRIEDLKQNLDQLGEQIKKIEGDITRAKDLETKNGHDVTMALTELDRRLAVSRKMYKDAFNRYIVAQTDQGFMQAVHGASVATLRLDEFRGNQTVPAAQNVVRLFTEASSEHAETADTMQKLEVAVLGAPNVEGRKDDEQDETDTLIQKAPSAPSPSPRRKQQQQESFASLLNMV